MRLEHLLHHGAWADARLLAALRSAPSPAVDALRELAHVRGAQEVWLARIEERPASLEVWPELRVDELERVGARLEAALLDLITRTQYEDLGRTVRYRTGRGDEFGSTLGDILLHLFMHAQYHRGKANAALRSSGGEPPPVDYIAWCRLGEPAT